MAYTPKPGEGAMFVNDKKDASDPSDRSPDRTGYVIAHRDIKAGERIQLAGWIKKTAAGHMLSLRASDPRRRDE